MRCGPSHTTTCACHFGAEAPWGRDLRLTKTKTLFKDIEVSYSTSFTATGISMLQMYSHTAVRLRLQLRAARFLRCCCWKPQHYVIFFVCHINTFILLGIFKLQIKFNMSFENQAAAACSGIR